MITWSNWMASLTLVSILVAQSTAFFHIQSSVRKPTPTRYGDKHHERYVHQRLLGLRPQPPAGPSLVLTAADITDEEDENSIIEEMNNGFRFGGIENLYRNRMAQQTGDDDDEDSVDPLSVLKDSTVLVVGLGGVGSWAAEALCRSGIGNLALVDLDDICMSNTNRQMHTLSSSVGKFKIDILDERFRDINPLCRVICIYDFVSSDNVQDIFDQVRSKSRRGKITAVLDAIDGSKEKAALLAACADAELPVVTCGAAAGCLDPTCITCDDLTRVAGDKLLTSCRTHMRKSYNFPPGLPFHQRMNTKPWGITAVYSTENRGKVSNLPDSQNSVSSDSADSEEFSDSLPMQVCEDSGLGTACFVTGSFGFTAAGKVVTGIVEKSLQTPQRN